MSVSPTRISGGRKRRTQKKRRKRKYKRKRYSKKKSRQVRRRKRKTKKRRKYTKKQRGGVVYTSSIDIRRVQKAFNKSLLTIIPDGEEVFNVMPPCLTIKHPLEQKQSYLLFPDTITPLPGFFSPYYEFEMAKSFNRYKNKWDALANEIDMNIRIIISSQSDIYCGADGAEPWKGQNVVPDNLFFVGLTIIYACRSGKNIVRNANHRFNAQGGFYIGFNDDVTAIPTLDDTYIIMGPTHPSTLPHIGPAHGGDDDSDNYFKMLKAIIEPTNLAWSKWWRAEGSEDPQHLLNVKDAISPGEIISLKEAYRIAPSDGAGGGGGGDVPTKPVFKRINTALTTIQSRQKVCSGVRTRILQNFINILKKDKKIVDEAKAKAADGKQEDGGGGGGGGKKKKIQTEFRYMTQDDFIYCIKTMGDKIKIKANRLARGPGPNTSWSESWFNTEKKNFKCTGAAGVVTDNSVKGVDWEKVICKKRKCCQMTSECPMGVAKKNVPCDPSVYIKEGDMEPTAKGKAAWCLTKSEFLIGGKGGGGKGKEIDDELINNIDGARGLVAYFNQTDPYYHAAGTVAAELTGAAAAVGATTTVGEN